MDKMKRKLQKTLMIASSTSAFSFLWKEELDLFATHLLDIKDSYSMSKKKSRLVFLYFDLILPHDRLKGNHQNLLNHMLVELGKNEVIPYKKQEGNFEDER